MTPVPAEPALQRQARALGDPTRYRIFRIISESGRPMRVRELVEALHLHHTVIRQHLVVLRDAGLLVETTQRSAGPGRPHLLYRASVDAATKWAGPEPYEQLSSMALEMLDTGRPPPDVGRGAGIKAAGRLAASKEASPAIAVVRELTRLGFDPHSDDDGTRVEVVLTHCPMAEAASRWPNIVCELHHGVLEGLARSLGAGDVEAFRPGDPHEAGCRFCLVRPSGSTDT